MKIYTKRGDSGMTDLFGGERVRKNHRRVMAYGDIDVANSALGLAHSAKDISDELKNELTHIMKLLFCAGAEVATADKDQAHAILDRRMKNRITEQHVLALESAIDAMENRLAPLTTFILPCGSDASARIQFARTMVRRVEVSLIELEAHGESVRKVILMFFNRLSDYLFVMARLQNAQAGASDIPWSGLLEDEGERT